MRDASAIEASARLEQQLRSAASDGDEQAIAFLQMFMTWAYSQRLPSSLPTPSQRRNESI
jgi:hypothetical protein